MSRARTGAYALWQLRDYLKDRGVSTIIVAILTGYLSFESVVKELPFPRVADPVSADLIARFGSAPAVHAARMGQFNYALLSSSLGALVFVGALFAMNGIVANDRKMGFYRFLFAKPVTPTRYYGQAFIVHWLGFLAVMLLLAALYGLVVWPVVTGALVVVLALMFLAYAGIAFLLSAAARWDWLSLVAASLVSVLLWQRFGASTHPLATLLFLLPPLHRVNEIFASVPGAPGAAAPSEIPWPLLAWLAGYGAACFVAGLVVLRYRRLAIV